jgi:hypothetical protein
MALDVGPTRVLRFEHLGMSILVPFLVVAVFWLCIIFASFGLFATRNTTVVTVLGVCALSVSGAPTARTPGSARPIGLGD